MRRGRNEGGRYSGLSILCSLFRFEGAAREAACACMRAREGAHKGEKREVEEEETRRKTEAAPPLPAAAAVFPSSERSSPPPPSRCSPQRSRFFALAGALFFYSKSPSLHLTGSTGQLACQSRQERARRDSEGRKGTRGKKEKGKARVDSFLLRRRRTTDNGRDRIQA